MAPSYLHSLRALIGPRCIHVPGVRAIILNARGEILLQRRADMNCWGLPAGAVELDETAFEALCREVREETDLVIHSASAMALYSGPHQRFQYPNGDTVQGFAVAYVVRDWSGHPRADKIEGTEVRFWPLSSLPRDMLPIHARTIADYRRYVADSESGCFGGGEECWSHRPRPSTRASVDRPPSHDAESFTLPVETFQPRSASISDD